MLKLRLGKVFFIIGLSVAFGLVRNVLLVRELSTEDMGLFTLAMTIVAFVYPITMLGQQSELVRFFSKNSLAKYNWKKVLQKILLACAFISCVAMFIAIQIYHELDVSILAFILVSIITTVIAELFTSITRAKGEYEKSILLLRSIRYASPIALLILYWLKQITLINVLIIFGILHLIHAILIFVQTYKSAPSGKNDVPRALYSEGLIFLGSDISFIVISTIDKFFLAKLTTIEELAVYFAVFTLTRLYELALQAVEYVLIPYSNRIKQIQISKFLKPVALAAGGLTIFYLILGPEMMRVLYKGKYDAGISLIPWFCAVGIVRMFYSIPLSFIYGRLHKSALKSLVVANSSLIAVNVLLVAWLTSLLGIEGAILATLLVWLVRTLYAYYILWRFISTPEDTGVQKQTLSLIES